MISVIVPVYNVEPYLRKCLNSVIYQTYKNLEILIIDDGSTDGSGAICDEYKSDGRIKVFHTENRGLSAARNLGLAEATGEWIGFVDSDDWIEPDMYETLVKRAIETGADVVECGFFIEYPNRTITQKRQVLKLTSSDAIQALLRENISDAVWCKIWKKQLFETIQFPEKRIFEEIATTYRLFAAANIVCTIEAAKYHYIRHPCSLSQTYDMNNLVGCWFSNKERYSFLYTRLNREAKQQLLKYCAFAVARTWAHYSDCKKEERSEYKDAIRGMHDFTCDNIPLFGDPKWDIGLRCGVIFPHFLNVFSFRMANTVYKLQRKTGLFRGMG